MGSTARQTHYQQVHYLRTTVALADLGSVVKIGTLPAGARILTTQVYVETAFNAGTTNTLDIGNAGSASAYMAAATSLVGATGQKSAAPSGLNGVVAADTDVLATFGQSGTAATTGLASIVISYIPNQ